LNTNVNALGCLADFLLLHFALLATTAVVVAAAASLGTHFHGRFRSSSWEWDGEGVVWLFRGCFDRGKNWDICLVRFLSHGGPLERRINRWELVLKKGIFAHMPTANIFSFQRLNIYDFLINLKKERKIRKTDLYFFVICRSLSKII